MKKSATGVAPRWKIVTEVVYRGVTYSRGSQLPKTAKPEDYAGWEAAGRIVRLAGDGTVLTPPRQRPVPTDADWLRGSDFEVCRRLREHATGDKRDAALRVALEQAVTKKRSPILIEALKLAAALPVGDADRRPGSVRKSA